MSEKEKTDILKALESIKNDFTELYERTIQQNSGSNSGLLSQMNKLSQKIEESQKENRELHEAQSKEIQEIKDNHENLKKSLEPIVKAFKEDENTKVVVDKLGGRILNGAKNVSAIGAALLSLWYGLKIIGNLVIHK